MHEIILRNKISDTLENKSRILFNKKQSKFHVLYSQALNQVKNKVVLQQQNLPLLRMKSYQYANFEEQKQKEFACNSQRKQKVKQSSSIRQKSMIPLGVRYCSSQKKHSVNRILWEKKMSLQTLRIASTKKPCKITLPKQLQKQTLRSLRQKTTFQVKDAGYDEQYNIYSHMSILPINFLSEREEKQRFIMNKKKIEDKFKNTFCNRNQKEKLNLQRKQFVDFKADKQFKNKIWEVQRDEDEFIKFVKEKVNINSNL